ncbi:unnamed protein product [Laminaria digitata]
MKKGERREKLTYLVEIPTVLDAGPYTEVGRHFGVPVVYDLEAVVHHEGTAHRGHCVAFARDTDGAWCCCNDDSVTSATEAEALTSGAYVLIYAKRPEA